MDDDQEQFLKYVAQCIETLLQQMEDGQGQAELTLGVRQINGRSIRLYLSTVVMNSGANPQRTHGMQPPGVRSDTDNIDVTVRTKRRGLRRRQSQKPFTRSR